MASLLAYLTLAAALVLAAIVGFAQRRLARRLAALDAARTEEADRLAEIGAARADAAGARASVEALREEISRQLSALAAAQTRLDRAAAARAEAREAGLAAALHRLGEARSGDRQAIRALAARIEALDPLRSASERIEARLDAVEAAQAAATDAATDRIAALGLALDALEERLASEPAAGAPTQAPDPGLAMPARVVSVLGP